MPSVTLRDARIRALWLLLWASMESGDQEAVAATWDALGALTR